VKPIMLVIIFACASGVAASRVGAQPTAAGRTSKPPTGVLRGRVIAADTGTGLGRARVMIAATATTPIRGAVTDANGTWEMTKVVPGRYTITVTRPPYVMLQYGQRNSLVPGTPVELADGQVIDRLDVRLPRGAVIAGRVLDDLGEPGAFIRVNAMRPQYLEGARQFVRVGYAQTDDLGNYRLYGLSPGTYFVMTENSGWTSTSSEDPGISFAATYHPSTTTAAAAVPVTVRAAQERSGVDIQIVGARLARVSGVVLAADGMPASRGSVSLYDNERGQLGIRNAGASSVLAGGRFSFNGVAPGDYVVLCRDAASGTSAVLPITIGGQDVDGLVVPLLPGSTVSGQVLFQGGESPPYTPSVRVWAYEGVPTMLASSGASTMAPDWTFELKNISPGRRRLSMTGLPDGYALKSVFIEDDDVIDEPRMFDGKETLSGVRLVVTKNLAVVGGTVVDDDGKGVSDYSVVLFATDPGKWGPRSRRRVAVRPDQSGRFKTTGLPPGDYFAVALDLLLPGEAEDPEFLSDLREHAVRFTLDEGGQQLLALKLTRLARQ
jgi:hypothetical protein